MNTIIQVTGSDTRMDARPDFDSRINKLPEKCDVCHFPNIEFVPEPYKLIDARTKNPNDLALAYLGNLFVRPRAKEILESVIPGQCVYYPTVGAKSGEATPWFLAVPRITVYMGQVKQSIQRCAACGEPKSAHWGTQFDYPNQPLHFEMGIEIAKSSCWGSGVHAWDTAWKEDDWLYRHLMVTLRLYHLFKAVKLKGLYEATCTSETKPSKEDKSWISAKLELLADLGISIKPTESVPTTKSKTPVKKAARPALPQSYLDFTSRENSATYSNVDEQEGFVVRILCPDDVDYINYRKGKIQAEDDESNAVDGVMFAVTDHGDCFCFDFAAGDEDPPVVIYLHEGNYFEPYATNFAECISRFEAAASC